MHMIDYYGPFWGMHIFWWAFWIFALVMIFGFNVPERTRTSSLDPKEILRRRLARGEISEEDYKKINAQLRDDEESARRNVTAQAAHLSIVGHPIVDGLSFSATWVIGYSLCSILYWIAPSAILTATSKLFHGLSFTQMAEAGSSFGIGDFVSVITLGAVYTFAAGIIWSLIHSFFLRMKAEAKLERLESRRVQKAS
jgi:putative membrane protein